MKIKKFLLRNFRRLEDIEVGFEEEETIFVGPNNSGKTSATSAFRLFLISSDFKIHDFSVSKIADIDAFGLTEPASENNLPAIEMDIWFSIDPDVEFGRVFSLLPNISTNFEEVGLRLKYGVKDAEKMKSDYLSMFPVLEEPEHQKPLSHYLSIEGNLKHHFSLNYYALENTEDGMVASPLEPEEGKRVIRTLLRVD